MIGGAQARNLLGFVRCRLDAHGVRRSSAWRSIEPSRPEGEQLEVVSLETFRRDVRRWLAGEQP
jgi:hypothetical protein